LACRRSAKPSPCATDLQDPPRFLGRERTAIAEHVDVVGEAGCLHGRQDPRAHVVDERLASGGRGPRFGRHRVRGQARRLHAHAGSGEPPRHPELAQLGVEIEAVAALHLERGGAAPSHPLHAREALGVQVVLAGLAGLPDAREDAAAAREDLLVVGARDAQLELVAAVAAPHHVRVRIDERGHQRLSVAIDRGQLRVLGRHGARGAHPCDASVVADGEARVLEDRKLGHRCARARPLGPREREDPVRPVQEPRSIAHERQSSRIAVRPGTRTPCSRAKSIASS
jgi:hypothetical protein